MSTPWLTDAELVDATHRRQPSAQARALRRMGVPYARRPDGTLLVGRTVLERTLAGLPATTGTAQACNGLRWRKTA